MLVSFRPLLVTGTALLALSCAADPESYGTDAETGSTHALVTVERTTAADGSNAQASAMAGFLDVPAGEDATAALELLASAADLPAAGQCAPRARGVSAAPRSTVEFLDAGEVLLRSAAGDAPLLPRALPTVSNLMSGVVYTTSDRSAESLPAGERYQLITRAGLQIPAIEVAATAPAELTSVTLDGAALADVEEVVGASPIALAWSAGEASDHVVVELGVDSAPSTLVCVFKDVGAATVPAGALTLKGAGRVSLRRVRTSEFVSAGVDRGMLRFELERVASVHFGG